MGKSCSAGSGQGGGATGRARGESGFRAAAQWGPRPKCRSMGATFVHKSMGAAFVHKSIGAASRHKSMGAASLHKSMGAASLHKSMGAVSLHTSLGAATYTSQWVLHPCTSQ